MAENDTGTVTADQNQQEQPAPYSIKVEDAGPGAKRVTIEIPQERIAQKIDEQLKDLRQEAAIPGFRKGHAPRKLLQKKFNDEICNEVRSALIRESYEEAVEKNSLSVIGEPEFDNPDAIKVTEDAPLTYSFQVEVQPDFALPEHKGINIKKPIITVTDEHVDKAMKNLREQQGTIIPVEGRGVREEDRLVADMHLKVDGNVVAHEHAVQFISRPARIAGIPVDDLPRQIEGAQPGETRTLTAKAPATHTNPTLQGKDVQIEFTIKDIKELKPAEINREFLDELGFADEAELRQALREQMLQRIDADVARNMRAQVIEVLLKGVDITVPARLSKRQAERVVNRRAVDLMQRGVSREQIQANIQRLAGGAVEEAALELKQFFVLQKLADELKVDVSEGELNGRIADIAIQQDQRPERLKQQMAKDGRLAMLYTSMREEKAIDEVLKTAQVEEVSGTPSETNAPEEQHLATEAAAPAAEASAEPATTETPAAPTEESSAT